MISITIESSDYFKDFFNNNKIICLDDEYFSSIEYIDNGINEVLLKQKHKNCFWYINSNNQLHNPIGPAVIYNYENGIKEQESYWFCGQKHRKDGPANIFYNQDGSIIKQDYYLFGHLYSKKDFKKTVKMYSK